MSGRVSRGDRKGSSIASATSGTAPRAGRGRPAVRGRDAAERGAAKPGPSQRTSLSKFFKVAGPRVVVEQMEPDVLMDIMTSSQTSTVTGSSPPSSSCSSQRPTCDVTSTPAPTGQQPSEDDSLLSLSPASGNLLMQESQHLLGTDVAEIEIGPESQALLSSGDEEEGSVSGDVGTGEEAVESEVEVDYDDADADDDVVDPTYAQPAESGGEEWSEQDDESPLPRQGYRHMSGRGRGSGSSGRGGSRQEDTASAGTTTMQPPATTTSGDRSKLKSPVWDCFDEWAEDKRFAVCRICNKRLSRGKSLDKMGTSSLQGHLRSRHSCEYAEFKRKQALLAAGAPKSKRPTSAAASSPTAAAAAAAARKRNSTSATQETDIEAGSQSSSLSSVSPASQRRQTLLSDTFPGLSKPLPARHRRIRKLNGLLARAMASQLLPYSLVQEGSAMRTLLQFGIPEWQVPSRHYFSRSAIPALHKFAMENVARSLDYSVGKRVHVTMDSWSSRFGTGRYLSFTAHWVTLVEGREEDKTSASAQLVVPPRGIRGDAEGSCHATPSAPGKQARLGSSSAKPRHCQALLKLVTLGKERLTAANVLAALRKQERRWLTPRGLEVGYVAADNGANLVAAVQQGNLQHIPCLAHVLNLVVQRFLRTYQGMSELLRDARAVVRFFRLSATASALLSTFQQQYGKPQHRLIIDMPVRWNSTLAMLERLCEHRLALRAYMLDPSVPSNQQVPMITATQWTLMQQVCLVLSPFLEATKMVSEERASVCQWVPLVCLLEQAMDNLIERGDEALRQLDQEQMAAAQSSSEEGSQQVVEELEVPNLNEEEEEQQSAAGVVRGWRLEEDDMAQEEDRHALWDNGEDEEDLAGRAHLFPMGVHMLRCLRRDPRVIQMRAREDIWITLMLDPRLKGKLGDFMTPSTTEQRTRELQEALVRRLLEAFPQPSTPTGTALPTHQEVPDISTSSTTTATTTSSSSSSSNWRPGDLKSLSKSLYAVQQHRTEVAAIPSTASQHKQRLTTMVSDYMGSSSGLIDTNSPVDPLEYWVKRLDIWSELSQYALELLSCPPSSVLSERCFSAAGGVVTEKRSRLSHANVDKLTFLKINQAWAEGEFLAPIVGHRGT